LHCFVLIDLKIRDVRHYDISYGKPDVMLSVA
jgi:hypothetical protein